MRLIDADKSIEKLRDFKEWENDDGRPIHTMSEIQRIDRCINFVQAESTAYDPDKVVEQLEELNKYKLDLADAMLDMQSNGLDRHFICLEDAIEIVKGGGIDGR